ncbi:MAG: 50S ribosomal protein L15 [Firmicutes bacterium]|nr:50S ribosomal protein L15 [Bacillota bacterium]
MFLHELAPADGAKKRRKRLGRGVGSGKGKTSGKGHKGQNARSGGGVRPGFEGGQTRLAMRLPKRGFKNRNKKIYTIVNLDDLEKRFKAGTVIDAAFLLKEGAISKIEEYGLKILGDGNLTKAFTIKAKKFTKQAEEKITKAGGKFEVV